MVLYPGAPIGRGPSLRVHQHVGGLRQTRGPSPGQSGWKRKEIGVKRLRYIAERSQISGWSSGEV